MTDHSELRRLAEAADALYGMPSLEHEYAISKFRVASTPKTILAMLEEIDGIKAENEVLRGALKQFAEMLKSINVPIDLDEILKGATQ